MTDDPPPSFLDLVRRTTPDRDGGSGPPIVPTGGATPYGLSALEAEARSLALTPEGARNDRLNVAVFSCARLVAAGHLDADLVRATLTTAARAAGLADKEIAATIASGGRAGLSAPRHVPTPDPLPTLTVLATNGAPQDASPAEDPDDAAHRLEAWRAQQVAIETEKLRARRAAERVIVAEEHAATWRVPDYTPNLTAELALPDEPLTYRIEQVMPTGANVLLTAQYKVGKTTLTANLAKALADGKPFLDRFTTHLGDGRVGLWNYEVTRDQYRRWLRETDITRTDAISVLNLRGHRMPLGARAIEDWAVDWLREHQIAVWLVDPYARAAIGSIDNENDNTQAGAFLDLLDVIKERAGVSELVLPTHTGRAEMEPGAERARGATRIDDWADVRWLLTADTHGQRFFRATGRDVEVTEERLDYDRATRHLTLGFGDRTDVGRSRGVAAVVQIVTERPGIDQTSLRAAMADAGFKERKETLDGYAETAEQEHLITIRRTGHRRPAYCSRFEPRVRE